MAEITKTSVALDPDVATLMDAERRRLADQAGLRNVSAAACINAILRRALLAGEARQNG